MKFSLSFLARDINQMPQLNIYGNHAVEAIAFDRSDLEENIWLLIWNNIEIASSIYGPKNVTFHFPINNSNYTDEVRVFDRLTDAYKRANTLGLAGVVVHSNIVKKFDEWRLVNIKNQQLKVIEKLTQIANVTKTRSTWLGLENMPIVGDTGYDIDPLFCFFKDFQLLNNEVCVVWDICHALSTTEYVKRYRDRTFVTNLVLRNCNTDPYDYQPIINRICHWHFSAFEGLNDPGKKEISKGGILPNLGTLKEDIYINIFQDIQSKSLGTINFEVEENDYSNRVNGPAIIKWAKSYSQEE